MPTRFITGCSSRFGLERRGDRARSATVTEIVASRAGSTLAPKLDVTNHAQIANAIHQTEVRYGGIDVLVNNAGHGYRGAVEEASETEIRD